MADNNFYNFEHPYVKLKDVLEEKQVLIIEDAYGIPVYDNAFITEGMLIVLCHQGTIWEERYDFNAKDVSIVLPKQIIRAKRTSEDFKQTIVAFSKKFFELLRQRYPYTRYVPYYRINPLTHLTDEQYAFVKNGIEVLKKLSQSENKYRIEMLLQQVSILLNVIGEYRIKNNPEEELHKPQTMLFGKFYESITEHFHEAHEISYYADIFCLSPKYFASIIKEETGISAAKWISDYIIIQAKLLLDTRKDYSIHRISLKLGFSEQASFSRYFKAHTGMTASEYRNRGRE